MYLLHPDPNIFVRSKAVRSSRFNFLMTGSRSNLSLGTNRQFRSLLELKKNSRRKTYNKVMTKIFDLLAETW